MDSLIGRVLLNRYRVDDFIASGGMGAVYRVWDLQRNAFLAMKVLHADLAEEPSLYRRFRREARALQKLAHPNIVPFYGLYQSGDLNFLLEAYIQGPTLKQVLKRRGRPLPIDEVLVYLKALTAALGYAHARGVVHCDVKPGNVMVDPGGTIFLTDFGIARHAESDTTTAGAAGTPAYMAPEQIRAEPVIPATDVYALGVMLFEMLTGQRPFSGEATPGLPNDKHTGQSNAERIRHAHLFTPAPDLRAWNASIPAGLAGVVMRAMEKDQERRFKDAPELFAAACAALGVDSTQVPDRAGPEPVAETEHQEASQDRRVEPRSRRDGFWLTGAAMVIVAALLAIFALSRPGAAPAEQASTPTLAAAGLPEGELPETAAPAIPTTVVLTVPTATFITPTTGHTPSPAPTTPPSWKQGRLVMAIKSNPGSDLSDLYVQDLEQDDQPEPLLLDPGYYMAPAWSRDGGRIACYDYGAKSLLLVSPQPGAAPEKLGSCTQPTWSRDSMLVMCRYGEGQTTFYDVQSGESFAGPTFEGGNLFDWSPLEDVLVFSVFAADGSTSIHTATTYGRDDQEISGRAFENYAPAWSHDGKLIAYQSNQGSQYSEIWVMDADGENPRRITESKPNYFSRGPTWSPDDQWIAYVSGPGESHWGEVFVVPVSGGEPVQVTNTGDRVYEWRVHWGN